MRRVEMSATIREGGHDVYEILSRFETYPEHSSAVRSVSVGDSAEGGVTSEWEVAFRNGILRWKECDQFDRERRTISFQQLEGDAEHFAGFWKVDDTEVGCVVTFVVDFDLGVPSLSDIIDPIAESALYENFCSILIGLLGEHRVDSTILATDTRGSIPAAE